MIEDYGLTGNIVENKDNETYSHLNVVGEHCLQMRREQLQEDPIPCPILIRLEFVLKGF